MTLKLILLTLFSMILLILLFMFMLLLNLLLAKKMMKNREKSSPFECGFDPMSSSRMPFSLQFYLISIIFLIFDVEIAVILPMIKSGYYLSYLVMVNLLIIMMILLLGLFLEWMEGALNWFN